MEATMKNTFLLLTVFTLLFILCKTPKRVDQEVNSVAPVGDKGIVTNIFGDFLGSTVKGNYIWGSAMNYAWNELRDTIIKEPITLETSDSIALLMADKLNNTPFTKDDMDPASYYVKSGFGQKTVDLINTEVKKKFPDMTLGGVQTTLRPEDIISFAYFLKKVEYKTIFDTMDVLFENQKVKGFHADNARQRGNVRVVNYWNDDKFIVKLKLKDASDELILCKGFNMEDPQAALDEVNKHNADYVPKIEDEEVFEMSKLHVKHTRVYDELINKQLTNKEFTDYTIQQMYEMISFDLDEKGARVENKAVIALPAAMPPDEEKKIRSFRLDKPFWVIMKRRDSTRPYFILGVNNTEIMDVKEM
jgi:hypothetical protein